MTEYKLSYTGAEINEKLGKVSQLETQIANLDVQPDWSQNDPTSPDYVKNRLAWTDDPVETVLFDGTVVNDDSIDIELIVGQEYVVTLDGVEYVLTAQGMAGDVFIGSESLWFGYDYIDTEPPFVFGIDDGSWFYTINGEYEDEHSLKIVADIAEVHKLDEKYIKDMYYDNRTILVDFDGNYEDVISDANGNIAYHYLTSDTFTIEELIGKRMDFIEFGERHSDMITSDWVEDINGDGTLISVDGGTIIICNAENTVFNDITFLYKGLYVMSPNYYGRDYSLQIYEGSYKHYKQLDKKYLPDSIVFASKKALTMAEDAMAAGQWKIGGYVPAGTTGTFELTVPRFTELKTVGFFKNTHKSEAKIINVFVNGHGISRHPFIRQNTHDTARWLIQVEETPYTNFLNATIGGNLIIAGGTYEIEQHSTNSVPKGFITDNNTIKFNFGEEVSVMSYPLTIYYR